MNAPSFNAAIVFSVFLFLVTISTLQIPSDFLQSKLSFVSVSAKRAAKINNREGGRAGGGFGWLGGSSTKQQKRTQSPVAAEL